MTKRIAYLIGEYPRATDTFIQREIEWLRKENFHIETISIRRPSPSELGTEEQKSERENTYYILPASLFRLGLNHIRLFIQAPRRYLQGLKLAVSIRSPGVRSLLYQLFYFAEAGLVVLQMKRRNLTHIHNHTPDSCGYVSMLAGELGKISYSMTLHGFGIFSNPLRWRLKEKLQRSLFSICISKHGLSQAMLWSERESWSKLHVVHCGFDIEKVHTKIHNGAGRNILFAGRLDHVKGLPILIEAFASLSAEEPSLKLHIVGDGPLRSDLESLVNTKNLNQQIIFHGYKSQKELQNFFWDSDLFVMTSFYEGIPVVLMEAMAYGIPVVAPYITGIPELIKDDVSGLLVNPGDPEALSKKVKLLLERPDLRNKFSEEGRKIVEKHFNMVTEIQRLAAIMHNYLD